MAKKIKSPLGDPSEDKKLMKHLKTAKSKGMSTKDAATYAFNKMWTKYDFVGYTDYNEVSDYVLALAGSVIKEGYKLHYPSLKKLTQLNYQDPRTCPEGKTIHVEKEGNFRNAGTDTHGHYIVYEDSGMPGSYIGIHVGSEISEDSGEAPIHVVAIDPSRKTVANRVSYRMRQSRPMDIESE